MIRILTLFFVFLLFKDAYFAQGEANIWYFGQNAGLDFNSGSPVVLNNGMMVTDEGCSSISDASGQLLFYTDGITVYNRNHQVMLNGNGLMGNPSSTQSGLIIKKPGSASLYYVFTTDEMGYAKGLRYSEINMMGDGGLGEVTTLKNKLLHTPTTEKLTGIRHKNNRDIWVVSHDASSNNFRSFKITDNGVDSLNPVISSVGEVLLGGPGNPAYEAGQMKAYKGGKKIATATYTSGAFELFDFDNTTGRLSNPILLTGTSGNAYGVEFSPDGSKLYCSVANGTPSGATTPTENLYQFDLCAGTTSAQDIINSKSVIAVGVPVEQGLCSMQLAPDGKIYVARYNGGFSGGPVNTQWLGVINDPNQSGLACNYVDQAINLGPGFSTMGLPNFVPYNLDVTPPPVLTFRYDSILCINNGVGMPILATNFALGGEFSCIDPRLSIDPLTGNIDLALSSIGVYDVKYNYIASACGIQSYDTTVQVRIENGVQNTTFTLPSELCYLRENSFPVLDPLAVTRGVFSGTPGLVINPKTGEIDLTESSLGQHSITYTVPAIGCKLQGATTVQVPILNSANASFYSTSDLVLDKFSTEIFLVNTSTNASSFSWDFGDDSTSTLTNPSHRFPNVAGNYLVTLVAMEPGLCNDTATLLFHVYDNVVFHVPNTFTPNGDENNNHFKPIFSNGIDELNYTFTVYNKWGEIIFQTHDKEHGWDGSFANLGRCQNGVYSWKIDFTSSESERIIKYGFVSLVR